MDYKDVPPGSTVVFLSHQWMGEKHPDPQGNVFYLSRSNSENKHQTLHRYLDESFSSNRSSSSGEEDIQGGDEFPSRTYVRRYVQCGL